MKPVAAASSMSLLRATAPEAPIVGRHRVLATDAAAVQDLEPVAYPIMESVFSASRSPAWNSAPGRSSEKLVTGNCSQFTPQTRVLSCGAAGASDFRNWSYQGLRSS